eukprot:Tamp_14021.p2 GENE.Tamp_14021~~Tamp_14021.p2  ORF type:complete len:138 (-),score=18.86 Tamp_14021:1051-1464(-)
MYSSSLLGFAASPCRHKDCEVGNSSRGDKGRTGLQRRERRGRQGRVPRAQLLRGKLLAQSLAQGFSPPVPVLSSPRSCKCFAGRRRRREQRVGWNGSAGYSCHEFSEWEQTLQGEDLGRRAQASKKCEAGCDEPHAN